MSNFFTSPIKQAAFMEVTVANGPEFYIRMNSQKDQTDNMTALLAVLRENLYQSQKKTFTPGYPTQGITQDLWVLRVYPFDGDIFYLGIPQQEVEDWNRFIHSFMNEYFANIEHWEVAESATAPKTGLFVLRYQEDTDEKASATNLRFFKSLENARDALKTSYESMKKSKEWPDQDDHEEGFYAIFGKDFVSIKDGNSFYEWEIHTDVIEDEEV